MNMSLDVLLYKINWAVVPLAMKLFTLSYFTRLRITLLIPGKGAPSSGRPSGQTVSSVPFSRSSCLCDPMDCSTPGLPIHHQLPEFTQTHVHRADDAIQPSHSLSSPSPPAFNLSQHQGFFPLSQFFSSGDQSIGVSASASVLPMNIQDWFPLGWTGWISLQSKGLSRVFSNTTVQKH